jgi:hypothetical protein
MNTIAKYNYNQFFDQPEIFKPSMNELNAKNHYDNSFTFLAFSLLAIGIAYYMLKEEPRSIKYIISDLDFDEIE